jgi:hypothetical protein
MSEATIDRDDALTKVQAPENPSPALAEEIRRPVRRRRSSPRKPGRTVSTRSADNPLSGPDHPSRRISADKQKGFAGIYRHALSGLIRAWHWVQKRRQWQLASKRLTLCETVSLGEKRFVAIVKVDGQQFLVGGAAGSVSLLAHLNDAREFAGILQQSRKRGGAVQ